MIAIHKLIPVLALNLLFASGVFGQESRPAHLEDPPFEDPLLDNLVGQWLVESTIRGQTLTQDISVKWVLHHRYVKIHQLSREVIDGGGTGYEALAFIGWDTSSSRYVLLWLDVTNGGSLSPNAFGHAKPEENQLSFVFPNFGNANRELHMTFTYNPEKDNWTIRTDVNIDGELILFSDALLTRD